MLCYQALIWNEDKISATSYAVLFSYRDTRIQQLNLMKIYFIMEYLGRNDRYIFMNANTLELLNKISYVKIWGNTVSQYFLKPFLLK